MLDYCISGSLGLAPSQSQVEPGKAVPMPSWTVIVSRSSEGDLLNVLGNKKALAHRPPLLPSLCT